MPEPTVNPYIVRDALRDLAVKYHAASAYGREARTTLAQWEALHPETVFPKPAAPTPRTETTDGTQ